MPILRASRTRRGRTGESSLADGTWTEKRRGFALVAVIGTLALVTVLFLGLMSNAATELKSATAFERSSSVRSLADAATNLFITQLRNGTLNNSPSGDGSISTWASQPGMIRTYSASGANDSIFKLYSDDSMVEEAGAFSPDLASLPSGWNEGFLRDVYADINSPALSADGELAYPVVYPPSTIQSGIIDGFEVDDSPPGFDHSAAPSASNNPVPMPVKWLYVLQDATVVAPQVSGATVKVPGATKANPIVGRLAFWADDNTAKVNINTASEGTYWDIPRVFSMEEYGDLQSDGSIPTPGLAICQPAQKEFQRFPGHPATTSLSPIFGGVLPVPDLGDDIGTGDAASFEPYYEITPRTNIGGSSAGTKRPTNALSRQTDRLYTTAEELLFTPDREDQGPLDAPVLRRRGFFLTASSNAPEITLFNTPRISMWPVHTSIDNRTAYDSLTAFCSTVGSRPYYFTRENSRSGTQDLSPRNLALYRYLQALTSKEIPGFGGNFLSKYGAGSSGVTDRDQILTYIYDYIRCTNLQDRSKDEAATPFTPLYSGNQEKLPSGDVVPIQIGATQGFGSYYSISEACLLFYGTHRDPSDSNKADKMRAVFLVEPACPLQGLAAHHNAAKYRVTGLENLQVDFGEGFQSLEFKSDGTNFIDATELSLFGGRSIGGVELATGTLAGKMAGNGGDSSAGAAERKKYPFFSAIDIDVPASAENNFKFSTGGHEITVEVRSSDTDELIQTIQLAFPDGEFRRPRVAPNLIKGGWVDGVWVGDKWVHEEFHNFFDRRFALHWESLKNEDTIVGLQVAGATPGNPQSDPTAGDTRMVQGLREVPSDRFRPHRSYSATGAWRAHSLSIPTASGIGRGSLGKLVPVNRYNRTPDVPPCVGSQVMRADGRPGDWDTGFGDQKDGAFINKPDEGDTFFGSNNNRAPYLLGYGIGFASATKEYFSPNRQIPSAMMLGSLPTGVQRNFPWQTLLFHPRPEAPTHPGQAGPKDHLIADLFWMPVVEPYAISQPFSTAGKVNMNYQIQPFTYIRRDTGLRAVMRSTKFNALTLDDGQFYKVPAGFGQNANRIPNRRLAIDPDKTLEAVEAKFAAGELFITATQIAEIDLIPEGYNERTMASFWQNHPLTGDNLRERPYVDLYPRLTTKSNTFTVHIRTQVLQKARSTPPDEWVQGRDQVAAEYRGSNEVERYIDPGDPDLPDFAALMVSAPNAPELDMDQYYQIRLMNSKRFAP